MDIENLTRQKSIAGRKSMIDVPVIVYLAF